MSEFSARWTFLFLILDEPYLMRFGIFSIPLSINFFPSTEFIALEPIFIPKFAIVLASPLPDCILLYFFLILLALSCVGVFAKLNLTLFFQVLVFLLFLGPIVLVFVTLMFPGKFFLLVLSYLATKDVPSDNLTRSGTARRPRSIFLSHRRLLLRLSPKKIFNKGFATSPRNGAPADAISPKGIPVPLCFLYRLFLSLMYQTPFLTDCFPLIVTNHHLFN